MLFDYKAVTKEGRETTGEIEAQSQDIAINSLQRSGLVVVSVQEGGKKTLFEYDIAFLNHVSAKEISMASRQIATLLEAHVPALRTFRLLAHESENPTLAKKFTEISDDIQNGVPVSGALAKHPSVFSDFYINMVRAGEESGKLSDTFSALADYLERSYGLASKVRGALIYPAFVVGTFVIVMVLMLTLVIPKLADVIKTSGQEVPIYTKAVIGASELLVNYGIFVLMGITAALFVGWRLVRGTNFMAQAKLWAPGIGNLYRMLYLSRIADNMHTMLSNGISMVRGIEITASVVNNQIYNDALLDIVVAVKGGAPLSTAMEAHREIPNVMIQMVRVGEETGEVGNILKKLSTFYEREVNTAVDTLVSLIEPVMIVLLGIGVGGVLASVLIPIYQIAGNA